MKCKACKAKDQTIAALADQVDWLRLQLGTPWLKSEPKEVSPGFELTSSPYVSDEEADIQHMLENNLLSPSAAQAALEQIGALNTEVTIN